MRFCHGIVPLNSFFVYNKVNKLKISKLRLLGFKSFVDPVELAILPGLTGVVGPNGCGKSNLLEALRWVMGENRPTSIRGGGMEDVIFAGAVTRPPKNFAEVMLGLEDVNIKADAFENESGFVDVIRRVTRDIGSSFRLNGRDVRAKDVAMLFADSSTGAYSPSLVRQGQITELINANPKSRRRLLEEAAGISGLYQRRHEAELKLKSSEINLERLHDVSEQFEVQLKGLQKQASQASRYRELGDEIREKEGFLLCKKWLEGEEQKSLDENSLMNNTRILKTAETDLIVARTKRDETELTISEFRKDEAASAASLQRLIVEREGLEKEQELAKLHLIELKNRCDEVAKDYERQGVFIRDAGEVIERFNWELSQLEKLDDKHDRTIILHKSDAEVAEQNLNKDEAKLDRLSEHFAQLSVKFENIEGQLGQTKSGLITIVGDLRSLEESIALLKTDQIEKTVNLNKAKEKLAICEEESQVAEVALKRTEKVRADYDTKFSNSRLEYSTADGRLVALRAERETIKESISLSTEEIEGVLNHVRIQKGFEDALGAAFADEFSAPIILDNNDTGWFELPDLEKVPLLPSGSIPISEKLTAPTVLKRRLCAIGLVDAADGPRLQKCLEAGQKLVSKEGDLWRWDGYCSVGRGAVSQGALKFKQENRLIDLDIKVDELEEKCKSLKSELSITTKDFDDAKKTDSEARNLRKKRDEKVSEALRDLSSAEADLNIINSKVQSLTETVESKRVEKMKLENVLDQLEKNLRELEDVEVSKEKLEKHRSVVDDSRRLMVDKRTLYDQFKRDANNRAKRIEELKGELENWQNRLAAAEESISELKNRKKSLNAELNQAKDRPNILADNRNELINTLVLAESKKAQSSEALSVQESLLRKCINRERLAEEKASGLREEVVKDRVKKESVEFNQEELRKSLIDKVGKEPKEFIETFSHDFSKIPTAEELENTLQRLKNKRESLGSVNLRAEEDLKDLSQELTGLISEKEDLEAAIAKLRSGILTLNSEGRARLLEAFQNVDRNFSELFKTLFGGGVAKLELVENSDPPDAGLEIMCQPPGKKLSTLSLLSGGEQTLTALSLIFAVFKANPSPICVLDEVDAPLDDANVERFCGLLDDMKSKTQTRFMVITHHPLTMSRMDRLYGVTMIERGVSQLVSVDLEKAEELLEV